MSPLISDNCIAFAIDLVSIHFKHDPESHFHPVNYNTCRCFNMNMLHNSMTILMTGCQIIDQDAVIISVSNPPLCSIYVVSLGPL